MYYQTKLIRTFPRRAFFKFFFFSAPLQFHALVLDLFLFYFFSFWLIVFLKKYLRTSFFHSLIFFFLIFLFDLHSCIVWFFFFCRRPSSLCGLYLRLLLPPVIRLFLRPKSTSSHFLLLFLTHYHLSTIGLCFISVLFCSFLRCFYSHPFLLPPLRLWHSFYSVRPASSTSPWERICGDTVKKKKKEKKESSSIVPCRLFSASSANLANSRFLSLRSAKLAGVQSSQSFPLPPLLGPKFRVFSGGDTRPP